MLDEPLPSTAIPARLSPGTWSKGLASDWREPAPDVSTSLPASFQSIRAVLSWLDSMLGPDSPLGAQADVPNLI